MGPQALDYTEIGGNSDTAAYYTKRKWTGTGIPTKSMCETCRKRFRGSDYDENYEYGNHEVSKHADSVTLIPVASTSRRITWTVGA